MNTKTPTPARDSFHLRVPRRAGPRPATTKTTPHWQMDQTSPPAVQEQLWQRMAGLAGVRTGPSLFSLPQSRALHLDGASGPAAAFAPDGTEFAHLHGRRDGSLHLFLPEHDASQVIEQGWGEYHPVVTMGMYPPTLIMVYGPRDAAELDFVSGIVETSYRYAHGDLGPSPGNPSGPPVPRRG
jgi:Family of unknown function (DUF5519)